MESQCMDQQQFDRLSRVVAGTESGSAMLKAIATTVAASLPGRPVALVAQ